MMDIRWSPEATDDLAAIIDAARQQDPRLGARISDTICDAVASLVRFPQRGDSGRIVHVRELWVPALPYVIAYRVERTVVQVVRVLHGSRQAL